jgi:hypothetical protein
MGRRQPLPIEALGKGLRVFRLTKAEHYEVAVNNQTALLAILSTFKSINFGGSIN